ncbi:NACHT domain-containing protein [Shewanella oncorhynchi]|uniref:NACHT domain-containing protein n=1 Tax=Shewanella oncorhynchi TaxID=2726434 RepID=A0AA50Q6R3_9GAMM|nr:NACHT domain-containing protein [Shewanella oncorhynchi]WMB74092.1 NACHT domain-containing protein [Shewanella oncorhynchi]
MDSIETATVAAIKNVAGKEAEALTNFLKKKITNKWQEHVGERELIKYQSKIIGYLYFFTINNPDQKTYIDDIYVPINIETAQGNKFKVESLLSRGRGFSAVSGVAGHGKSTFLRHLMRTLIVDELSEQIPIFFELKYFKDDRIEIQLCEWLNQCGLQVDISFVTKLLREGRFTVLLDAFDELPSDLMDICEQRIVQFCQNYENINLIVTTRPNLQISRNSLGNHYQMVDLDRMQVTKILEQVCESKADAINATSAIFSSSFASGAIKTPILAVLVSLTYKRWKSIPKTMSEFYNRVFNTLLSIHDNTKSGKQIRREIKTNLEDVQILSVVNNLSYYLTIDEKYNFTKFDFDDVCLKSLKNQSFESSELDAIFKCLKSACNILVKDGFDEYKYIHRSFQEFYAAKYITSLHHSKKKVFYSKCLSDNSFGLRMREVIKFLCEIDEVYMYEFYIVPYLLQNKCIAPYKHLDIFSLREINFTHLVEIIIESKSVALEGRMIETSYSNLFIYILLLGEDVIDEISEQIDILLCKNDLSIINEKLVPSHTTHRQLNMYPAKKIVELYYSDDSFIQKVCRALEEELSDAETELDRKLDKISNKTEEDVDDVYNL